MAIVKFRSAHLFVYGPRVVGIAAVKFSRAKETSANKIHHDCCCPRDSNSDTANGKIMNSAFQSPQWGFGQKLLRRSALKIWAATTTAPKWNWSNAVFAVVVFKLRSFYCCCQMCWASVRNNEIIWAILELYNNESEKHFSGHHGLKCNTVSYDSK